MKERCALLNAELVSGTDNNDGDDLIRLINENVKPPEPVTAQDILIRSMYIVSDEVNSYGGRFPVDEHDRLASLLIDSPVLVGHRKDGLPIGRTFYACVVERNGRPWVRSYFYWLKSVEGAETLRDNIDKGVYKECSIGFTYLLPECSVCGDDIRRCRHNLFQSYGTEGNESRCHFNYRKIERVLETSLVFRGATPGTAMSKDLAVAEERGQSQHMLSGQLPILEALNQLSDGASYLVVPHYEGKFLSITRDESGVLMEDAQGNALKIPDIEKELAVEPSDFSLSGKLVGYRGKERRTRGELERYLATGAGPITRVILYLYPDQPGGLPGFDKQERSVRMFHHAIMSKEELAERSGEFATKHGVEIWEVGRDGQLRAGVRYMPSAVSGKGRRGCDLLFDPGTGTGFLRIDSEHAVNYFAVPGLRTSRVHSGVRYIANATTAFPIGKLRHLAKGEIIVKTASGGYRLKITGSDGEIRLQPARLHGQDRFLLYLERGN
jgi:hypothetical protein